MITAMQQLLLNEAARLRIRLTVVDGQLVFDFSNLSLFTLARMLTELDVSVAMRTEIEKWWISKTRA